MPLSYDDLPGQHELTMTVLMTPDMANFSGKVHGGAILKKLDEVAYACANDLFGSIDANQGDAQLGWDTDQFPLDIAAMTEAMYHIINHGGFTSGGFNFDTKVRRSSIDLEDLFYGNIGGIDALALSLLKAATMIEDEVRAKHVAQRYAGWQGELGQHIFSDSTDLSSLAQYSSDHQLNPSARSAQQERLENYVMYNQQARIATCEQEPIYS